MVDNYFLNNLTDDLKRPGGHINMGGLMVATLDLKFGAKSQMRLEASSDIVQFYNTVGISITNNMIQ